MRAEPASLGSDPEHALRLVLRVLGRFNGLQAQLRQRLALRGTELQALLALWDGGRCTMTDLGSRIGLSRAAITTLTDRIETKGLLERLPDPTDRRRILVSVTPRFEAVLFEQLQLLDGELAAIASADAPTWQAFANAAAQVREAAGRQADALQEMEPIAAGKARRREPEVLETHW